MPHPNPKFCHPRVGIEPSTCKTCGSEYLRTANEIRKFDRLCPTCKKVRKEMSSKQKIKKSYRPPPIYKTRWEIILPKTHTPHLCKKRNEWYMRVRTRRRNTQDTFVGERLWLGVKADATEEQVTAAYAAVYARKEMEGHRRIPAERVKKYAQKRYRKHKELRSFRDGKDRHLGINKVWVRHRKYRVVLPNPLKEKGVIVVGLFDTEEAARQARDEKYRELRKNMLPCAVCGNMPTFLRGALTHIDPKCPNATQLPEDPRPLYQVKMWNHFFRKGEHEPGVYTADKLVEMGFMRRPRGARLAYGRSDVELDIRLHKNYAKTPKTTEEDFGFE